MVPTGACLSTMATPVAASFWKLKASVTVFTATAKSAAVKPVLFKALTVKFTILLFPPEIAAAVAVMPVAV